MKLIFVRHGQTDWNRTHRIQGATDIPLNETGLRQAEELKSLLAHTPIDCAVTSPLLRARQTAEVICRDRGIRPVADRRAAERGFGTFEGRIVDRACFDRWWRDDFDGNANGIEPTGAFTARVSQLLDELRARYPDGTVLLVAHGGVSIAVRRYFVGPSSNAEDAAKFLDNCVPAIFEIK